MKKILISLFLFATSFVIQTSPVHSFTLDFDENGNGTLDGVKVLSGTGMSPDGISGALYYALPSVGSGYVLVWDDSNKTILSDVLNFQYSTTGSSMWYYSSPDGKVLADLSKTNWDNLMSDLTARFGNLSTYGTFAIENADGNFTYNVGNIYNGISGGGTPTPEPATMLLFGTGLVSVAGIIRRKKQA
ncbi:MAG: PEP-CTERM sorting domain-containing protein [Desulfocapsaceae bacterium]|nr:PEP-CTERM sorting domain-containing protein [Desulfocapsaceae bacterium]